jgi:transcriptional regulator with XRE-family HTH domain
MRSEFLPSLAEAIRAERRRRGLNQADLAARVGRAPARISELERDLQTSRLGKDRLTLLAEICDALDLVMVLRPRDQLVEVGHNARGPAPTGSGDQPSVFDELFVDLSDEDEDSSGG